MDSGEACLAVASERSWEIGASAENTAFEWGHTLVDIDTTSEEGEVSWFTSTVVRSVCVDTLLARQSAWVSGTFVDIETSGAVLSESSPAVASV